MYVYTHTHTQVPCSKPLHQMYSNNCTITQGNKIKVNFTLEHATKAQRGNSGIALLFL